MEKEQYKIVYLGQILERLNKNDTFFPKASKHSIILYAEQIFNRLFTKIYIHIYIELEKIGSNDSDILEDKNFER